MRLALDPAWRLRTAEPADASAIRDLTRRAYARWVPVLGREPLPMTADYEVGVRRHRFDLLTSADERLLALIETRVEANGLLILNLAVDPALQGRGLGPRLLSHAEMLAREQGLPRLRLYTHEKMAKNVALYQRLGYAVDRFEPIADGRVVHLSKPVTHER
jgi:ribosomal protein S18 acetylase RimI-like enzyme